MSNSVNLSKLLNTSTTINTEKLSADVPLGTEDYTTANDLPATGNQVGDQAFVQATNRLYIWTGAGWYNIALINQSPTWDSGGQPAAEYELDSYNVGSTIIQLSASDPEGLPITWDYSASDSAQYLATIQQDSSVFTITALPTSQIESYDSTGGTFNVTFRATDGINIASALSEFTISLYIPYVFQGSTTGYYTTANQILRFPYASETITTEAYHPINGAPSVRGYHVGMSSKEAGYVFSGYTYPGVPNGNNNNVAKFPFAAGGSTVTFPTTSIESSFAYNLYGGAGMSSETDGYRMGGYNPYSWNPPVQAAVKRYPFASETPINSGSLTQKSVDQAPMNGVENGYVAGGQYFPPSQAALSNIQKYSFASNGSLGNIGNIDGARNGPVGAASATDGYAYGGRDLIFGTYYATLRKMPFANEGNTSNVGDLSQSNQYGASSCELTSAYVSTGSSSQKIKFAYANEITSQSVLSMTGGPEHTGGYQI